MATLLPRMRPAAAVAGSLIAGGLAAGTIAHSYSAPVLADDGSPSKAFRVGPNFLSLPLESSEQVNHNTKRLRFRLPDPESVSGLPLTSSLLTITWPKGSWFPLPRPYTPITPSDEKGHVDLLVKLYPDGRGSGYLHSLQPGQSLTFAAALPGPRWPPANPSSHVTLIAGGAGITPIFQLAQGILSKSSGNSSSSSSSTSVTLVFGANADRDVLLRPELDNMERRFPGRFRVVYTVSRPEDGSPYRRGYVTRNLLEEVVPSAGSGRDGEAVYVCGPPAMEKALLGSKRESGVLQEMGFRKDQIHKF